LADRSFVSPGGVDARWLLRDVSPAVDDDSWDEGRESGTREEGAVRESVHLYDG